MLTDERTGEQIILSGRQQKKLASFFKKIIKTGKEKLDPTDLENNRSRNMLNCALRATDEELQKEPRFYFLITQILIDRLKK